MSGFNNLNRFIDGELPPEEEQQLFLEMASDDELRFRMKQMYAMKSAIGNGIAEDRPSDASTAAVFGALGFSTAGVEGYTPPQPKNGFRKFAGRYVPLIAILGLTVALLYFLLRDDRTGMQSGIAGIGTTEQTESQPPVVSSTENNAHSETAQSNADASDNTSVSSNNAAAASRLQMASQTLVSASDDDTKDQNAADNKSTAAIENSHSNPGFSANDFAMRRQESVYKSSEGFIPSTPLRPAGSAADPRWSVEFSRAETGSLQDAPLTPDQGFFANTSLAIYYRLFDRFSVGMEARNENFYQRFNGMDETGRLVTYHQYPTFLSYGVNARYRFMEGRFSPVGQLGYSLNKSGYIGRAFAGLEYRPYPSLGFILGADYGYFNYMFEGNSYNTSRIGLKYGIMVNF